MSKAPHGKPSNTQRFNGRRILAGVSRYTSIRKKGGESSMDKYLLKLFILGLKGLTLLIELLITFWN